MKPTQALHEAGQSLWLASTGRSGCRSGCPRCWRTTPPRTAEGLPVIEECIYAGVPVNVTLLFSAEQYRAAAEAYLQGGSAGFEPD